MLFMSIRCDRSDKSSWRIEALVVAFMRLAGLPIVVSMAELHRKPWADSKIYADMSLEYIIQRPNAVDRGYNSQRPSGGSSLRVRHNRAAISARRCKSNTYMSLSAFNL